jgi:hypothetical protein
VCRKPPCDRPIPCRRRFAISELNGRDQMASHVRAEYKTTSH